MPETRVLLACPQMEELALDIVRRNSDIRLGGMEWKRFPDRFPDLMLHDVDQLVRNDVSFLACFDDPAVIFEQWSAMRHVARLKPKSFRILLPYFPTGTMERSDHEGQVATAESLATMLSALPAAGPGPIPVYIWDIHALPIKGFFGDNVAPRFKTGLKQLFTWLEGRGAKAAGNLTIVFPDDGAKKRFGKMEPFIKAQKRLGFAVAVCRKERVGDERKVVLSEGDVHGRYAVVIDDLVHSGGTLLACGKAVREAGASVVDAYVTHGVLENGNWRKFDGSVFRTVIITDSCPATAKAVHDDPGFRVLSLVDSIVNAIRQ